MAAFVVHLCWACEGVAAVQDEIFRHFVPLFPQDLLEMINTRMRRSVCRVLQFVRKDMIHGVQVWAGRRPEVGRPKISKIVHAEFLNFRCSMSRNPILSPHIITVWIVGLQPRQNFVPQDLIMNFSSLFFTRFE